jgi:hypothetical protein
MPLVLAQVDVGATGSSYQLFAVNGGAITRLQLRSGSDPYDLYGGGALEHGQELTCRATSGGVVVTQVLWLVTGNEPLVPAHVPGYSNIVTNPPTQPIRLTTERFTLGGTPVHLRDRPRVRVATTTYAQGMHRMGVSC